MPGICQATAWPYVLEINEHSSAPPETYSCGESYDWRRQIHLDIADSSAGKSVWLHILQVLALSPAVLLLEIYPEKKNGAEGKNLHLILALFISMKPTHL